DEQLDLHGPRAKLPFEQIPPSSRAGVKSSHETLEQDNSALIVSNGTITSGGVPDLNAAIDRPGAILVSPLSSQPVLSSSSSSLLMMKEANNKVNGDQSRP